MSQVNTESLNNFRVYSEDTDFMGIVYHANYLKFFERARSEFMRKKGITIPALVAANTQLAIHDIQIKFLHPAKLDDLLTIETKVIMQKACSLIFQQIMTHQKRLISQATVHVVCLDENLKPKRLPKDIDTLFVAEYG